jgi:FkbM family methyltransferase
MSLRASPAGTGWEERLDSIRPSLEPITAQSQFGPAGKWIRQAVFRAVRPVIFAEHQVHLELARAIESVGHQICSSDWSTGFPEELNADEVVDLDTPVGKLFLHRDDQVMTPFISEHGHWEPDETAFLRAVLRPGYTFLDVGANVGYMTVLGAQMVGPAGRAIAVEPDSRNLRLLRANLWRNGVSAQIAPIAAFSRRGFIRFVRSETNRGDHQVWEGSGAGALVPCTTVDELLGDVRVDVAKIDTQGVDHQVLEGMQGLVRRNPAIVVLSEFWLGGLVERGVDPMSVLAGYADLGFSIGLLGPGGSVHERTAQDVIDACRAWEGLYVNLVLTVPEHARRIAPYALDREAD